MLPNFRETRHEKFGVLQTYLDLIHNSSFSICIPFLNSNSFIKVHRPPLYLYCFPLLFAFLYESRLQSKDLNIRTIKCFLIFLKPIFPFFIYTQSHLVGRTSKTILFKISTTSFLPFSPIKNSPQKPRLSIPF
jgi:hypothetical protein